jgi:tetratricopeptide (TPR) repeat protein
MGKFSVFLLLFLLCVKAGCSQPRGKEWFLVDSVSYDQLAGDDRLLLDSILKLYHKTSSDTVKINLLGLLSEHMQNDKVWSRYNQLMLASAEKKLAVNKNDLFSLRKKGDALSNYGYLYSQRDQVDHSLQYHRQALAVREKINDRRGIGESLNNIGFEILKQGDEKGALARFLESLKIQEELNDVTGMAQSYSNIAMSYIRNGEQQLAIDYFNKSHKLREQLGDKFGIAFSLHNLAYIYQQLGDLEKAREYFAKCISLRKEMGDRHGEALTYSNLGYLYIKLGKPDSAKQFFEMSISMAEEAEAIGPLGLSTGGLAELYMKKGDYKKALPYAEKSMELFKQAGQIDNIGNGAIRLKLIFEKVGRYKEALAMHELFVKMRDSIYNQENRKNAIKSQFQFEYEKKSAETKALQDKKDALAVEEKQKQKLVLWFTIGGLLLVIIFSAFLYNRFLITKKQKKEIDAQRLYAEQQKNIVEMKQREILDSIRYAKRIQSALITSEYYIRKNLQRLNGKNPV